MDSMQPTLVNIPKAQTQPKGDKGKRSLAVKNPPPPQPSEIIKLSAARPSKDAISWDDSVNALLGISLGINSKNEIQYIRRQDGTQQKPEQFFGRADSQLFVNQTTPYSGLLLKCCYSKLPFYKSKEGYDNKKDFIEKRKNGDREVWEISEFGSQLTEIFKDAQIIDLGCGGRCESFEPRMLAELWGSKQYIGVDKHNISETTKGEFGYNPNFQSIFLRSNLEKFLQLCKQNAKQKKVFILSAIDKLHYKEESSLIIANLKRIMKPGDYIVCDDMLTTRTFDFANNGFKLLLPSKSMADDYLPYQVYAKK